MYKDKLTKSVADAVRQVTEQREPQVLNEELKGNQHKIDANKNNKIDAHDFKLLRSKKQVDEAKYEPAEPDAEAIAKKKAREEAQRRREEKAERDADDLSKDYKPKTQTSGVKKVAGKAYGGAAQKSDVDESVQIDEISSQTLRSYESRASQGVDTKDKDRSAGIAKARAKIDQRDRTPVKESFSGLLESYANGGIKSLFENLQTVEEQASEEEFNAELKKQKDKAEGKAPQADVAAAATQGTKDMKESTHTEVEVVDSKLNEMDYGGGRSPHGGHNLPRDAEDEPGPQVTVNPQKAKDVKKDMLKSLNNAFKQQKEEVELEEGRRSYGGGDYYQGGGHSYHTKNSDGTDISVYVPPKRKPIERRVPTYKPEPKHSLHGKHVTDGNVHGKLMGTEHQGEVAKIKHHETGKIHYVDAKKVKSVKEEFELEERTLTAGETAEKERIVKGMKKGIEGFKQRYGERAKEVMYATATKQAKED